MTRLGILTIFLFTFTFSSLADSSELANTIEVKEIASRTIRLKSVLSLSSKQQSSNNKLQKIFWSFKRLYAMPNLTNNEIIRTSNELSQVELMISLDAEVQDNLKYKYATSNETGNDAPMFDLIIYNLTFADSGLYKCNLWNQKTIYYKLIVSSPIEKPEISLELSSETAATQKQVHSSNANKLILESTDLTIKCLTQHAYPLPTFKWFENGVEIQRRRKNEAAAEIVNRLVDKETNAIESSLKLRKVRSEHHLRNFTCKVVQTTEEKTESEQVSDTVTLNVAFKPIVSLEVFKQSSPVSNVIRLSSRDVLNLYQHDSDDVLFRCVYRANPSEPDSVEVVWKINGVVQENSYTQSPDLFSWNKRSTLSNDKRVNLSCEVANSVGKSSFMVEINQLFEPRLKLNTTRYQVDEFAAIQLNCSVEASPSTNLIEWRKYSYSSLETAETSNEKHLIDSSNSFEVLSSDSLLEFKSIKHTDTHASYFVCAALNSMNDSFGLVKFGERKFKFDVDVRFKPQMNVMSPRKLAVASSHLESAHNQNISCLFMANPQPVFNWYKNGVKLNSTIQPTISRGRNLFESVLTIQSVSETDLNTKYECEAMNQLGVNRWEIELVRESAPERPSELRVDFVDFMRATVSWTPGFDGGRPQTFFLEFENSSTPFEIAGASTINGVRILPVGPHSMNLTGLSYNTRYSIRISARNDLGQSDWSDRTDIQTTDITESSADLLPHLDSLFLNVPRNRIEFEFKEPRNEQSIPICFKISELLLNSLDSPPYSVAKCLSFDGDQDLGSFGQQFDLATDLKILESPETVFNPRLVKSMRVNVCFRQKPTICARKPTQAIIDTFSKMSPSYKHRTSIDNNENGYLSDLGSNVSTNRRFAAFIAANSKLSIAIMVGVCGCVFALCVVLFGTVLYCIRKRNFKLCKALLSQEQKKGGAGGNSSSSSSSDGSSDKSSSSSSASSTASTGSSRVSSSGVSSVDGGKKQKSGNEKTRDLPSVMSESEHRRQQQQTTNNKPFNIDIASISAPMSITQQQQQQQHQITNVNMAPLSLINPINPLQGTTTNKTNSLNSRRAFTAALTATANTIIGKHKQLQEAATDEKIRVTEDEEKTTMRRGGGGLTNSSQPAAAVVFDDMDDEEVHNHSSDAATSSNSSDRGCSASSDDENHKQMIQVASSQTSSTAVSSSNCSSTHLGPPYTLYSPFDVQHQVVIGVNHTATKIGFCSDSTGSNSDPIAINNSLSSNSTTDSPTYGYNLATGVNCSQLHYHHNELVFVGKNTSGASKQTKSKHANEESGYSTPSRPKKVVYEVIV